MAIANFSKYEDDDGNIHRIRMSTARVTAAGGAPAGDVDDDLDAKISRGAREFGLRPRYLTLTRVVGTAPNQFRARTKLPVLTSTAFDGFNAEDTVTIDSVQWTVAGKVPESIL